MWIKILVVCFLPAFHFTIWIQLRCEEYLEEKNWWKSLEDCWKNNNKNIKIDVLTDWYQFTDKPILNGSIGIKTPRTFWESTTEFVQYLN